MQFESKKTILAASLLLSTTTFNANAKLVEYSSLEAYTGAGGTELVYGHFGNLTWTADGNLFHTLATNYSGGASAFVNAVINSVPGGKINDTANFFDAPSYSGFHNLSASDFNTSTGTVDWFGAKAFTAYLNSISYGGSTAWRLPTWTDTGAPGEQFGYSGTDYGYNVNTASSELAELYYDELGKKAYYNTSGVGPQSNFGILGTSPFSDTIGSVGPFSNVHTYTYWLGTEYAPNPSGAWGFDTDYGIQYDVSKGGQFYAWAVSPGQVAAVPVPGAIWLFGSGLIGLLGLKQRGNRA